MKTPMKEMLAVVDDIGTLDELLESRERLRRCFAAMQDAAAVTSNPIFEFYLAQVAIVGQEINAEIKDWFVRAQILHGEVDKPGRGTGGRESV